MISYRGRSRGERKGKMIVMGWGKERSYRRGGLENIEVVMNRLERVRGDTIRRRKEGEYYSNGLG